MQAVDPTGPPLLFDRFETVMTVHLLGLNVI
jgi:hypothetical protein